MKTILVIAAHSDDEALGCGGTIAKHVAGGDDVHVVFMADGVSSREGENSIDFSKRTSSMVAAAEILGISSTNCLGFPDNKMDTIPLLEIIKSLEIVIDKIAPEVIYTHHYGDLNIDHRLTHQAVMTACRPTPNSCIKKILAFEVVSSSEWSTPGVLPFIPNYFVNISDYLETKISSLNAYSQEMHLAPHSRSIKNIEYLAKHRGFCVGSNAAEAFEVIRIIDTI